MAKYPFKISFFLVYQCILSWFYDLQTGIMLFFMELAVCNSKYDKKAVIFILIEVLHYFQYFVNIYCNYFHPHAHFSASAQDFDREFQNRARDNIYNPQPPRFVFLLIFSLLPLFHSRRNRHQALPGHPSSHNPGSSGNAPIITLPEEEE